MTTKNEECKAIFIGKAFVLVRQLKDKTNKLAKTKQEGQDNSRTREDNSGLPNKPKTFQKDNSKGARQFQDKGRQF